MPHKTILTVEEPFNPYFRYNGIFIPEPIVECDQMSDQAKILMGRLFRYAGKNGKAYPGRKTLAKACSWKVSKLDRIISELKQLKLIITKPYIPNDKVVDPNNQPSEYIFLYSMIYETGTIDQEIIDEMEKNKLKKNTIKKEKNTSDPVVKNNSRGVVKNNSRGVVKNNKQKKVMCKRVKGKSFNKLKDVVSGETNKNGNDPLNNRVPKKIIRPIVKPIDKQKDTSDRQVNKSSAKPKKKLIAKYKHSTIDLRNYSELVNAGATNHKKDPKTGLFVQQTGFNSLDKLHALFSPVCEIPYKFANNIINEYDNYKWTIDDLLDAFKFQLEHSKIKSIKNIGNFIFTQGFNGSDSWSPLINWHSAMKRGITGELNEQGKILFKSLGQRKCTDIDKLHANDINKIAERILPIENKHVFFNGKSTMNGYAYGIISVASEFIKNEKQNKIDFNWRWITKPKFADELLEHVLKYNIMRKKTNGINMTLSKKVIV
ncbi:MAG: helix-turn-helix domain-containing protein [Candidatus Tenebribacter davisii]|nr:helix-turn-helix domain-containing protein [Candidatus Tenebribacter davisii]